jgi:flagellar protein FliO/FliZ
MKRVALPAIALAFPSLARAADGPGSGFSFASGLVQMCGALAVVLGIIYLLTHLSRRMQGMTGAKGRRSHIRIVETRHLAPKKSLMLVEVAGEYLLLSNGGDGVSLVKQIDMLEEIEVVELLDTPPARSRFQEKMEELVARLRPAGQLQLGRQAEG